MLLIEILPGRAEVERGNKQKNDSTLLLSRSLSGYQDSNLGPPAPKAGALTGLRYTPKTFAFSNALQR